MVLTKQPDTAGRAPWVSMAEARFRVDNLVTTFENTTSDHLPVLTRYVVTN